jgi:hypothetical protein
MCQKSATKNKELILTYLIPCHLVTTHTLPTEAFLANYPRLERLFGPLLASIKRASLSGFDAALQAGEAEFVKRRVYLTLERARDVVIRNVLRRTFMLGGFEAPKEGQEGKAPVRRTRVPVAEFVAAVKVSLGQVGDGSDDPMVEIIEDDEVECMIANMIYKVCICRVRPKVVLSANEVIGLNEGIHLENASYGCAE